MLLENESGGLDVSSGLLFESGATIGATLDRQRQTVLAGDRSLGTSNPAFHSPRWS
jgi:hypothetical protein